MSSTESTPSHGTPGNPRAASGDQGKLSTTRARRQQILRADPYYPHTVLRAVFLAAVLFFASFGCAVFLVMTLWPQEITRHLMVSPAIYAVIFAGGQFALHRFRVGRLEEWGRIPRSSAPREI